MPTSRLEALSPKTIDSMIAALEESCPPVVIDRPEQLIDEQARLRLAFDAGRASVVTTLRIARQNAPKED